jgi:hypothetical protein
VPAGPALDGAAAAGSAEGLAVTDGTAAATGSTSGSGVRAGLTGVARQFVGWGAIDAAIVGWGYRGLRRALRAGPTDDELVRRGVRLGRITAANALLDVGYVACGLALARRPGRWRGDGVGIVVQGLALLWLDVRHSAAAWRGARAARS